VNIAVVGTGYVGLVSGACLADFGHAVTCVDIDTTRVAQLNSGDVPFYEPGLSEIVTRNRAAGRLAFTADLASAVRGSLVIFIAVGTPEGATGEADISAVLAVARDIGASLDGYRVVVTKSTVPIGTNAAVRATLAAAAPPGVSFDVVSNPEFLREGAAITDFMRPDRVVIGAESDAAAAIVREIYRPLYLIESPMVVTDLQTAEMIKYASNAFLAVKISFINEVANLCEEVGADVHVVAKAMGLDKRIGSKFLHPGPGFGGSCFPKDTKALAAMGAARGTPLRVVEAAIEANTRQRHRVLGKLRVAVGDFPGRTIAVLGLSFKPNTTDVRESPALWLCAEILRASGTVRAFDPVAMEAARRHLGTQPGLAFAESAAAAVAGADAIVVMTEWNEFRALDLYGLRAAMRGAVLIDTRNVFDPAAAIEAGFTYRGTGRANRTGESATAG
jgi:UDPglucose 6-dehydrogenase